MKQALLKPGKGGIASRVNSWQRKQTDLIHGGGLPTAQWAFDSGWNLDVTFIDPGFAFRQDGIVYRVDVQVGAVSSDATWKFKIFRLSSGTTYNFVSEQNILIPAGVARKVQITLDPPLAVQMGDVPGLYVYTDPALTTVINTAMADWDPHTLYVAGDITAQANFTSNNTAHIDMDCFMYPPYLAFTGDSIAEGHNGDTNWHSGLHDSDGTVPIPGGEPTSEIANQIRAKIGNGEILKYQNLALGSQGFDWVRSAGVVACVAVKPHSILIHCGIVDILNDVSWEDVLVDLDAIRAATTKRLLLTEILPCTNADDTQAATVRTWNASLATWCASNNATLIVCHDAFGQVRVSTGELDDLLAAYSQDGTHLTTAGVDMLADIIVRNLTR